MRYLCATSIYFCTFVASNTNLLIMAKIIARCRNNEDRYYLSIRVYKRNVINNAIPLEVSLSKKEWQYVDSLIRDAEEAENKGRVITFADNLASNLWKIKKGVESLLRENTFSVPTVRAYITKMMSRNVPMDIPEVISAEAEKLSFKDFVRKFIAECESGERLKQKSTRKVALSTIKNYKGTLSQIEAYEAAKHKKIGWEQITMDFYDDWKKFFLAKGYSPNTIGRHVKNLKIWMYAAKDMGLTKTTDFESSRFAADHEEVDNVYLTEERIAQMDAFTPTDKEEVDTLIQRAPKKDRKHLERVTRTEAARLNLEKAKDIFVVGCLTGQRVSDYKRITLDMVQQLRDGNEYIYLQQEKTRKWIYIPLDARVKAILKKYDGKLPKMFDQHINEKIKIVGRLLGWCEDAGISEYHGLLSAPSGKKFYECIKTHTARRSFATNAYKAGIALSSIMAITGHSSESMLRKYLKLDNKERAILAASDFAKVRKVD